MVNNNCLRKKTHVIWFRPLNISCETLISADVVLGKGVEIVFFFSLGRDSCHPYFFFSIHLLKFNIAEYSPENGSSFPKREKIVFLSHHFCSGFHSLAAKNFGRVVFFSVQKSESKSLGVPKTEPSNRAQLGSILVVPLAASNPVMKARLLALGWWEPPGKDKKYSKKTNWYGKYLTNFEGF